MDNTMTPAEKLKNLLELEIIPDLEVAIDELFAAIDKAKSASRDARDANRMFCDHRRTWT